MSQASLEQRVSQLELQVSELLLRLKSGCATAQPARDDWKKTVGMFRGDPVFQEMLEETARRREAEREEARRETSDE